MTYKEIRRIKRIANKINKKVLDDNDKYDIKSIIQNRNEDNLNEGNIFLLWDNLSKESKELINKELWWTHLIEFLNSDKISLGLIKGRHNLPVYNRYILDEDVKVFTKDELIPLIEKGLNKFNSIFENKKIIQLYITGLTIVTLTTVELLKEKGMTVEIMGYDPIKEEYYCQGVF